MLELIISALTLIAMESALNVDNLVFMSIQVERLPQHSRKKAYAWGMLGAMGVRTIMICCLSWVISLMQFSFNVFGHEAKGGDVILLGGGLFLIWQTVKEMNAKHGHEEHSSTAKGATFGAVQRAMLITNVMFSFDSVLTAFGMTQNLGVMIAGVLGSSVVMWFAAQQINSLMSRHPSLKMIALSFLMMIGVMLIADGCGQHIPKGYIYFAMVYVLTMEWWRIRQAKQARHVNPHHEESYPP